MMGFYTGFQTGAGGGSAREHAVLLPGVTRVGYNGRRGDGTPAAQGWADVAGGTFTPVAQNDGHKGYCLDIVKNNGQAWEIKRPAPEGIGDIIRFGGRFAVRFRLTGEVVNNRYAFAFYLKVPAGALPEGVRLENAAHGSPALAAFCVVVRENRIALAQHKTGDHATSVVTLCDWGTFDNQWHTLELRYAGGNSISVTPVLDGRVQAVTRLSNSVASVGEGVLSIMSVSRSTTYRVHMAGFECEVYRDSVSRTLSEADNGLHLVLPPNYHTGELVLPDRPLPQGFAVRLDAAGAALNIRPENSNVLLQPVAATEGYPEAHVLTQAAVLMQAGVDGKSWRLV